MPRFVAKPVIVEAHQWMGTPLPLDFQRAVVRNDRDGAVLVQTGDGLKQCRYRDMIGRDGSGQFFVMTEAAFEARFDPCQQDDIPRVKRPYVRRNLENV